MNYNLSRLPGTYEFDRESFGFSINSKIYNAREYCSLTDSFKIINNKKLNTFINALITVKNKNIQTDKDSKDFHKCVNYIIDSPLYSDTTIPLYIANQSYIPLITKLVMRKLIIAYLKKENTVKIVEELSNENKFYTTFIIKNANALKNLSDYLWDLRINKITFYEDILNKNINKIGKSNYLNQSKDKLYKIDPKRPIKFSNVADEFDCSNIYTTYINLIYRISQIYLQIKDYEQEANKNFNASIIWTI